MQPDQANAPAVVIVDEKGNVIDPARLRKEASGLLVPGKGGLMVPAEVALADLAAEKIRKGREEKRDREAALAAARKRIPVEAEKALQEIQAGDRLKIDGVWFEVKQVTPAKGRGQVVLEVCPAERLPAGELARDRMVKR